MSRLIYDWLNNESHDGVTVGLSRRVESIATDFSSGYLLGELLYKYNQQSNFNEFIDKSDGKTINLCLLEPTMRAIGVTFSTRISADVASGKEDTIKQLLYEMKTSLDAIVKLSNQSMNGKGNNGVILKVISNTRSSYDRTRSLGFENSLKAYIKSSDDSLMEKVIEKYQNTKLSFRESVNSSHAEVVGALQSQRDRIKDMDVHKKEHEKLFNKAWEHMNTEKWKKNMHRHHERVEAKRRFVEKTQARTNFLKTQYKSNVVADTYSGLDEFDRRMQTEVFAEDPDIKETVGKAMQMTVKGMPGTGAPDIGYIDQGLLQQGFVRAQLTIKEHHDEAIHNGQLHDRRRRRFIRERESAQANELEKASDREILEQMLLPSNAELWEDFAYQKVQTRKKILLDNASHRKAVNAELDKSLIQKADAWRKEEANREVNWVVSSQIDSQMERIQTAKISANSAIHEESISNVSDTLEKIFDLVEWCVTSRSLGAYEGNKLVSLADTTDILPDYIWKDGIRMFLSELNMAKALPHVRDIEVADVSPFIFADKLQAFDESFIFTKPLQTHDVVCLPTADVEALLSAEPSAPIVAIKEMNEEGRAVHESRFISQMLANHESSQFFANISTFSPAGSSDVASSSSLSGGAAVGGGGGGDVNSLAPPAWSVATAPRYYLGEALVVSSCTSDPLPSQPKSAFILPKFDIKLSVVCNSEVLSKICVKEIVCNFPGIFVISVSELANAAVLGAEDLRNERVAAALERGLLISDDLYVELIVNELIRIGKSESYNSSAQKSFVLADFPKTRSQAIVLFKALSGIDFSDHCPQALDRQSKFATCVPRIEEKYDVKLSGLDCCICISGGDREKDTSSIVIETVGARVDLRDETIVYLNPSSSDQPTDVKTLHEPYCYERPLLASGLDAHYGGEEYAELNRFLEHMTVSESVLISSVAGGSVAEVGEYVKKASIEAINARIGNRVVVNVSASSIVDSPENAVDPAANTDTAAAPVAVADSEGAKNTSPSSSVQVTTTDTEVKFNRKLAEILCKMWHVNELQSKHSSNELFNSLRDVRYQILQRRRAVFDNVSEMFLLTDERQSLYFDFVSAFNAIDQDFRFDPDCKAELHLRTIELGDQLWQLCDKRKARVEEFIQSITFDGAVSLNIYRCQTEAASKMQSEFARFYSALHVIFDSSKGVASYNRKRENIQAENVLEEALAITLPTVEALVAAAGAAAAGGKGKDAKGGAKAAPAGKKGEAPTAVPFRDPLAPVVLPANSLQTLPEIPTLPSKEGDAAGGKGGKAPAKAPAKGKEVEAPKDVDVAELMEKAILEVLGNWEKGKFTVQRLVYNNDESYSAVVEQAVWFECDRLKASLAAIRSLVADQSAWIKAQEADLIGLCNTRLKKRYGVELNAVQRLTTMIGDVIEAHDSLRQLWLISPDIIAVHCDKLLVKDDDPFVVPSRIMEFYHDTFNEEQKMVLMKWIELVRLGDLILVEDLRSLLNHCQLFRGTLGSVSEDRIKRGGGRGGVGEEEQTATVSSQAFDLLMPPALRKIEATADGVGASAGQYIFEELVRDKPVVGSDDRGGTVAIKDLLTAFKIDLN